MVQDIERIRQTSPFPESPLEANAVCYRTYGCHGENLCETWDEVCDRTKNNSDLRWLNMKVGCFLKLANKLAKTDERVEKISRPLAEYSRGVFLGALEKEGPSLLPDDSRRCLVLSSERVASLSDRIPKNNDRHLALLVSLFHEVSHIAQGLKYHEDVQRMKRTGIVFGRQTMGELDLQSDFLAVHTASLFHTFHSENTFVPKVYVSWFHKIWCEVCRLMLPTEVEPERDDKQRRIFGYLLMSNLTKNAYVNKKRSLGFEAELWPVWGESLDNISIITDKEPLVRGNPVNPHQMRLILQHITSGQYESAATEIDNLWSKLPRRC